MGNPNKLWCVVIMTVAILIGSSMSREAGARSSGQQLRFNIAPFLEVTLTNVIVVQEQTCTQIGAALEQTNVQFALPSFCAGVRPQAFDCNSASCTCQCDYSSGVDDCVDLALSGNCSGAGGGLACSDPELTGTTTCTCFWKHGGESCPQ